MSMINLIVEAGKLLIDSEKWPATDIPEVLQNRIYMTVTKQGFRSITVTDSDDLEYRLVGCHPDRVKKDPDGNDYLDKAMVGSITGEGFIGQVRRRKQGRENWHLYRFPDAS